MKWRPSTVPMRIGSRGEEYPLEAMDSEQKSERNTPLTEVISKKEISYFTFMIFKSLDLFYSVYGRNATRCGD